MTTASFLVGGGERRVCTILFCDVPGSTAIAERLDPEEWAEIMNGAFAALVAPVSRYEGTVARLMGDAVLAYFGAPVAHEDDATRAVLAGLEMIRGIGACSERARSERDLPELSVRIGVNTGLVVLQDARRIGHRVQRNGRCGERRRAAAVACGAGDDRRVGEHVPAGRGRLRGAAAR